MLFLLSNKGRFCKSYTNSMTKEMDNFLAIGNSFGETYLYEDKIENYIYIRYVGATRGRIVVDDNDIIQDITLYEDTNIYKKEIYTMFEKYIGMKILLAEDKYTEVVRNNSKDDMILYLYSTLDKNFLSELEKNFGFLKKGQVTYIPVKNIEFKKKEELLNKDFQGRKYSKCYLDGIILDKDTLNLLNLTTIREGD